MTTGVLVTPEGNQIVVEVGEVYEYAEHRLIRWYGGILRAYGDVHKTLDIGTGYTIRAEEGIPKSIEQVAVMDIHVHAGRMWWNADREEIVVDNITTEITFRTMP